MPVVKVEPIKPIAAGGGNEPEQIIDLIPIVEPKKGHFTQHIEQQAGEAPGKKR